MIARKPRLGMLGVGWIGRHRMQALVDADAADIVAIADPSSDMAAAARALAPAAVLVPNLDAMLMRGIDGVVVATPSAMHADQTMRALQGGAAVFCQKPLGRTAAEVAAVIDAARTADRTLAVDLSYRFTEGMRRIRELVRSGGIGQVYAVDLVFHNAYGPDKDWFYDRALSGGGCVIDLGVHLVDLCLWVLDFPGVIDVSSRLFSRGARLPREVREVEDYAVARLDLAGGVTAQLACSWRLALGCDAVISVTFHGAEGSAAFRNLNGSFYDFSAMHYCGTHSTILAAPPDAWGGGAVIAWARALADTNRYDPHNDRLIDVASAIDRIYGRPVRQP